MTTLTTFPLFPALPTELRLKIWTLNLPGPRIVALNYTYAPPTPSHRTSPDNAMRGCTSPTRIPRNLHTNREARNEALGSYVLSFNIPHGAAKIFFDAAVDILYFGPKEGYLDSFKQFADASSMMVKSEVRKVRRLAVHENLFAQANENVSATRIKEFWEMVQRKFEKVEEVVIVSRVELKCCAVGGGMCEFLRKEGLTRRIERGLKFVKRGREWKSPTWCVTPFGEGLETLIWPDEELERKAVIDAEIEKEIEVLGVSILATL